MKVLLAAIYPYAFLLLYIAIPFDNYVRILPNILMIILLIAFPFVIKKEHLTRIKKMPLLAYLGFVFYLIISAFARGTITEDIETIKRVLLPVGLVLLYVPIEGFKKINKAIIYSAILAIVFSVINIMVVSDTYENFIFGDSPRIIEGLLIDRIYLGLLSVLSILVSFQSIKNSYVANNKYYLANIFINLLFLFLIISKVAALALVVIGIVRLFFAKNEKVALAALVGIMVLPFIVFSILPDNFKDEQFLSSPIDKNTGFFERTLTWDLRTVVWSCADAISKESGISIIGDGFETSKEKLVACYSEKISDPRKKRDFVGNRYNSHNQFLDFYLSAGFIGFLFFMVVIAVLAFRNKDNFVSLALLATAIVYLQFENIFNRQIGAYYLGFILIYLLRKNFGPLELEFFNRGKKPQTNLETVGE